jgi:diguanylate cyclase (GGDEF)-like protein
LATHDGLTGLLNHRQFMHLASDIAQRMTEAKEGSFSMIMFDLDHFKRINDTYGHSAGDLLLYRIGQLVTDLAKNGEICARYGGEEFIILCTGGTEEEAYDLAESIRSTIEQTSITHQGHAVQVTASFGVGHYDPTSNGKWETCINQADTALYRAKEEGRNRVCCFSATS